MSEKDDRDWFELVAGRDVPDADPAVRHEADLVRTALLQQAASENEFAIASEEADAQRTWRLIERARAEGLIAAADRDPAKMEARSVRNALMGWMFSIRGTVALVAALLLAVGVAVMMSYQPVSNPEDSVSRGGAPRLIVRDVTDPAASAKRLAAELDVTGLRVSYRSTSNGWYVETDIPENPGEVVLAAFQRADILVVQPGPVRVIFRRKG